jgi:hypothetical protein
MHTVKSLPWPVLALVFLTLAPSACVQPQQVRAVYRPFSLSLVHPVTTFVHTDPIVTGLSLNLLDGNPRSVYGLEVGAVLNRTREQMFGLQFAGAANVVFGELVGVQITAGINTVMRPSKGLQLGLLWNRARAAWTPGETGFSGAQISLFGNYADTIVGVQVGFASNSTAQMDGVQIGWANVTDFRLNGLQLGIFNFQATVHVMPLKRLVSEDKILTEQGSPAALAAPISKAASVWPSLYAHSHSVQIGLANVGYQPIGMQVAVIVNAAVRIRGLMIAAVMNLVFSSVHGGQLALGINYAGTYVEGFQLALVNLCDSLRGLQLGLINISGQVRGVQLGLVNIAYHNRVPFLPLLNIGF